MQAGLRLPISWRERLVVAGIFAILGFTIIHVFSPYRPTLTGANDTIGRIALSALLFALALWSRTTERFSRYSALLFALFTMLVAVSLDFFIASFLLNTLLIHPTSPALMAMYKLNDGIIVVLVVMSFTRLWGDSQGSIYLQKGNLKLGLLIGLVTFLVAAALAVPLANLNFKGRDLTLERILPWLPWLLIFVFANAFNEELLYRGLFFRKLEPFLGKFPSNLLVAVVFTLLHLGVTYSSDQYAFLAVVFPLALLWGYIMQKTDAVWASVLFHAGMDLSIVLGMFSNL